MEVVGTFWIVRKSVKSADDARRLLNCIGMGLAAAAAIAIVERYLGLKISDLFPQDLDQERFYWSGSSTDITGTYQHRILLGLACALGALKYLQDLMSDTSKSGKGLTFLCAVGCLTALYFSVSRGPWLAFGIGFIGLVGMMGTRGIKWGLLLAVLVLSVLLARPGIWTTISDLSSSTFDATTLKGSSYQWRFVVIETALAQMSKAGILNELFGFGGGSQIMNMSEFGKYEIAPGIRLPVASWDCEYAVILYDRGWLGLLLLLLLSGMGLARIAQLVRATRDAATRNVSVSVFVGLLFFATARTNVALYAPQLTYVEMLLLGLASVLLDKAMVENQKESKSTQYAAKQGG